MELIRTAGTGERRGEIQCFEVEGMPSDWLLDIQFDAITEGATNPFVSIQGNKFCVDVLEGQRDISYSMTVKACSPDAL